MEITAQNAIYLGEETGGKGRQFKARFLVPGLVKYDYGVCLLTKENADKFIQGFTGCPVIINHQTVTDKNVKDIAVGDIFSVWFDEKDGYYWCNGILRDKEAIKLINEGYSVSCQYLITEYSDNTSGALHNGNPYDKVIENGKPEHLAIVNNPRYEGAIIAVNAIMAQNEDKWITIHPNGEENKGRHLLLKDGESVEDAMHRNGWYKKRQAKETQKKDEKNQYLKKGDLETDKVYKLGNIYVKPFIDKDGDLAFYDKTGAWGEGSVPQKFLKSDLKNLERVEKYDKLTDKELKFLSEKGDFKEEKEEKSKTEYRKYVKEQSQKQPDTKDGKVIDFSKLKELKENVNKFMDKEMKDGDKFVKKVAQMAKGLEKDGFYIYENKDGFNLKDKDGQKLYMKNEKNFEKFIKQLISDYNFDTDTKDKQPDKEEKEEPKKYDEIVEEYKDYFNESQLKEFKKELARFDEYKGLENIDLKDSKETFKKLKPEDALERLKRSNDWVEKNNKEEKLKKRFYDYVEKNDFKDDRVLELARFIGGFENLGINKPMTLKEMQDDNRYNFHTELALKYLADKSGFDNYFKNNEDDRIKAGYDKFIEIVYGKNKASNSFVEQFKDTLYTVLAEGIYNRLGE